MGPAVGFTDGAKVGRVGLAVGWKVGTGVGIGDGLIVGAVGL